MRLCKLAGTIVIALLFAASAQAAERPPNIVLILVDDMGWADPSCYGNTFNETPNMDRLASQGMRFTSAYAACPVCSPTRASIMSGQYPARLGVTDFITGHWRPHARLRVPINRTQFLPLEVETVAETLKSAGYATAHYGKWHLGNREHFPDKQGFDDSVVTSGWGHFGNKSDPDIGLGEDDYLSETLTGKAIAFMEANRARPFFIHLAHFGVHIPLEAREVLVAKYEAKAKEHPGFIHPVYAAMVEHIDQSVGSIMDALDRLELADDTLLVLFSDNGGLHTRFDGVGREIVSTNAPLRAEKGTLYEGGIRVPLIVRWPGKTAAGTECDVPVSSVDLYPTFAAAAGAALPDRAFDGLSLAPLLEGKAAPDREAIYWHYPHYHHSEPASAMRKGDWKVIEYHEDGRLELFNLARDPGELHDLSTPFAEDALALRDELAAWRESVDAAMPEVNPEFDAEKAHIWGKHPSRGK